MRTISIDRARKIALAAQGFKDPRPTGAVTERHFRRVLDRMGILQLDSVNVLCRSHFLPVFARLGPYDQDRLDRWIWESGENHEYVTHEASITSMDLYPAIRHRMSERRWRSVEEWTRERPGYLQAVYDEVSEHGPLSVKDLSDPGDRNGPWWGHSQGKTALELLYSSGKLSIHKREKSFLTVYDIAERVVPPELLGADPIDIEDARRQLLMLGAKSHGIGTDADLADYARQKVTKVRPTLADLVAEGELEEVQVAGWDAPAYLHPEAAMPRTVKASTFLSPFDPVVWFRPRAERLFNFHYRIEIYVPEPKRVYGYYVLPFLLGDQLVGRVDLKADRKAGKLLARGVYAEDGVERPTVAAAMAEQLQSMASWLGLDDVVVSKRGNLAAELKRKLR